MKNTKKDIYEKIMAKLPEILNEELGELSAPRKEMSEKPAFVVDCSYCDSTIMKKLDMFDVMAERTRGGVRVLCPSWSEVLKVISIFEQFNAFEREALNGKEFGAVKIYKWRSSMNDSVVENVNEARSYKENTNPKGETPRAHAKREAMRAVQNGDLPRNEEAIKEYLLTTGLWEDISETRLRLDIKFVMDKTEGWDQQIEGDYIADFSYSRDAAEVGGRVVGEDELLAMHIQYLIDNGLQVETKKGRYSTKIYIHYDGKRQYEALVKWAMWDLGMVESIHNGGRQGEDREEAEEIIASGKAPSIF